MKLRLAVTLLLLILTFPLAHGQGTDPYQHCRKIVEPMARLACYDATAPVDPRVPAGRASANFGLPERNTETVIHSAVSADFSGWKSNTRITLENGQVWQVVDGSTGYVGPANRKVVVRRAALGSYRIKFEGLNKSPTVRRIK